MVAAEQSQLSAATSGRRQHHTSISSHKCNGRNSTADEQYWNFWHQFTANNMKGGFGINKLSMFLAHPAGQNCSRLRGLTVEPVSCYLFDKNASSGSMVRMVPAGSNVLSTVPVVGGAAPAVLRKKMIGW